VHWAPVIEEVLGDRGQKQQGEGPCGEGKGAVKTHPVRKKPVKAWFGASRRGVTGFVWDRERREILWEGRTGINPVTATEQAEIAEEQIQRQGGGTDSSVIALDLFAGNQSMGPVYCWKPGVEYVAQLRRPRLQIACYKLAGCLRSNMF